MKTSTGRAGGRGRDGVPTPALRPGLDLARVGVMVVLAVPALWLDRRGEVGVQLLIAALAWITLLALLRAETTAVRAQVAVLVAVATAAEFVLSEGLGYYVYRLDNVPAFVPPGHGLVYLAALYLGRNPIVTGNVRRLAVGTAVVGLGYAGWGLFISQRHDAVGALAMLVLLALVAFGPSRSYYIAAFVVVTYLELLGTSLGTWTWAERDPAGWLRIGNPPSGVAGGYGVLDLAALTLGPAVARRFEAWRRDTAETRPPHDSALP